MEYTILQPRKPEHIALSFSGGGFRAASYSLGCLSYLETVRLGDTPFMSHVKFISSASGGTIINLSYGRSRRKGIPFHTYYQFMTQQVLDSTKLLDRVFMIIKDKKRWEGRPEKSRNLINAFSIAYDELIFEGEQFNIFLADPNCEICVNTTEFDNGMLFRFQNVPQYGNFYLRFRDKQAATLGKLKLGDILAASSCFPIGFEPLMFPVDFTHETLDKKTLQQAMYQNPEYQGKKQEPEETIEVADESDATKAEVYFGLMDGGIDDNQGIASFMLAERRMQNKNEFGYDLYLSCDVSSNYTEGFEFSRENTTSVLLKPTLLQYAIGVALTFALSVVGIANDYGLPFLSYLAGASGLLLIILIMVNIIGVVMACRGKMKESTFAVIIFRHIRLILTLRLSVILSLLWSRAKSAGQLAAVVFLKKIRRSSYDRLFETISERRYGANKKLLKKNAPDSEATHATLKHWRNFALQNAVYLLSPKNDSQREETLKDERWSKDNPEIEIDGKILKATDLMKPSQLLQQIAKLASDMDTTLWYDQFHIRDKRHAALIAAGQFTSCYNLLRYAMRFDPQDLYWLPLQLQLAKDWLAFNEDPYWMYNDVGKDFATNRPAFLPDFEHTKF